METPKQGLIAIAGVIGVGKTTLAEKLARKLKADLILEEYDQNPFLAAEMMGQTRVALACELFFLFSRARQLNVEILKNSNSAVCDYIFPKNRIFAKLFLDAHQMSVYDEIEKTVIPHIHTPDTVIYLTDKIENCLDRICRRGRQFEKYITGDWLFRLSRAYEELFQNWQLSRLIRIDCTNLDFRRDQTVNLIAQKLQNQYNGHKILTKKSLP